MLKKIADITIPKSSSLKLSNISKVGKYKVYGASGVCGYLDSYQVETDCVAIVKDGAGIGRVHFMEKNSSVLGTMQIIIPNLNINTKYLYYMMKFLKLGKTFNGATIPHIYYKDYSNTVVKVVELEEQEKIVYELDSIEFLIENKVDQINFLNELIKSRFIGWEVMI